MACKLASRSELTCIFITMNTFIHVAYIAYGKAVLSCMLLSCWKPCMMQWTCTLSQIVANKLIICKLFTNSSPCATAQRARHQKAIFSLSLHSKPIQDYWGCIRGSWFSIFVKFVYNLGYSITFSKLIISGIADYINGENGSPDLLINRLLLGQQPHPRC